MEKTLDSNTRNIMTEAQVKFNNFVLELDARFLEFQVAPNTYSTQGEYWMHRNCVLYDYEIHRLRKFANPCQSCGLPLHLTKNFEIYGVGPVCRLCHTMHTIISENRYFYELDRKSRLQGMRNPKNQGEQNAD